MVVTGATLTKVYPADNVLVVMDGADTKLYTLLVSVPFRGSDFKENTRDFGAIIGDTGIVETKAGKLGMFICYEVLLPWPVLTTAYRKPDVLVAGINGWWAPEGSSIPGLQRSVLQSWASLFGVPGVAAINR